MADTTLGSGVAMDNWAKGYFKEYIREERFNRYSGESPNNVFQNIMDLTRKPGDNITITLVGRLQGSGITGDNTLAGNEEALPNFSDKITVDQIRQAVVRGEHEQSKTALQILEAGKFMLKKWSMETLRDLKIARLYCPNLDGVTTYAATSATDRNAWEVANSDRVLFGQLLGNYSGVHATDLLNVDTTDDTLKKGIIELLRRIAETADPHIKPLTVSEDEEWYVAFVGSNPYRDLRADLEDNHEAAGPRGMKNNPIWRDGDLVWNGVVIRCIPEMASVGAVGAASAPVYPVAFCGCQAVGVAWGERTKAISNGPYDDYGNRKGAGIKETRGAKKLFMNESQFGMVTGYVAAAADA